MEITAIQFWLGLGAFLIFSEIILPGLVSMFIGLGAITVAVLLHYHQIDNIPEQLIVWFVSSTIYIFSLRLLVMKYYPMDTKKEDIDEDNLLVGQIVEASEDIPPGNNGRISFSGTTWQAKSINDDTIKKGDKVKVLERNNITWLVERVDTE